MKILFQVKGMHCSGCAMTLESIEDDLDGIKRVSASFHKQQMEVEFDDGKVSTAKIIQAAKQKGYELILEKSM